MLDIKPLFIFGLDCFENAVATACTWMKIPYELAFFDSWKFRFDNERLDSLNSLASKVNYPEDFRSKDFIDTLKRYCGVELVWYENNGVELAREMITKEISENRPVLMFLDVFYAPWRTSFESIHSPHFCIVTGISNEEGFYCVDTLPVNYGSYLPFDLYMKGSNGFFLLKENMRVLEEVDFEYLIKGKLQSLLGKDCATSMFDNIWRFADYIENEYDLASEFEGLDSVLKSTLLSELQSISNRRLKFSLLTNYLSVQAKRVDERGEYSEITNGLQNVASKWFSIRVRLAKSAMSNELNNETKIQIASLIRAVSDQEETIAKNILDTVSLFGIKLNSTNNLSTCENKSDNYYQQNSACIPVDISGYFNSRVFDKSIDKDSLACFSGSMDYLIAENIPSDKVIKVQNMVFKVANIGSNLNDNICCNGQEIKLPEGFFNTLMILACSAYMFTADKLIIKYKDGSTEYINIQISEWWRTGAFGEFVAWKGGSVSRRVNGVIRELSEGHLLASEYNLNSKKIIQSITVPDCQNLHIFAISLM